MRRRPPSSTLFPYTPLSRSPPAIPLSLVEPVLEDEGVKGAEQAIRDNQTTGRFLGHEYRLGERIVPTDGDLVRSEEHTSELQSRQYLVCRLLLEKKQYP